MKAKNNYILGGEKFNIGDELPQRVLDKWPQMFQEEKKEKDKDHGKKDTK